MAGISRLKLKSQRQARGTTLIAAWLIAVLVAVVPFGCVERTVTINTEPEGATVFLNDQEVGQTPVRVPFTWYGDYDIIVRKKGHQTLQTHQRIDAPWYQWPVIDLFAECFMPFTIHDDRVLDTYVLAPKQVIDKPTLLESASQMKEQALMDASSN